MSLEFFSMFKELLLAGGFVMPPLVFCTALLWYCLGYRYLVLRDRKPVNVRDLLEYYRNNHDAPAGHIVEQAVKLGLYISAKNVIHLRRYLDEAFYHHEQEIRRFATPINVVVMVAPLLGLLGTVAGMIETFDSLAEMALFTQSGGIAGGISQALITTQMGLAVAIPGVLLQSILSRKQRQIHRDLAQIKDLLCSQAG